MAVAIHETLTSVVGSSITTIAGFAGPVLHDLHAGHATWVIVMAKGVLLGVLGCVTILPSLILVLDKPLQKTTPSFADSEHERAVPSGVTKVFPVFLVHCSSRWFRRVLLRL